MKKTANWRFFYLYKVLKFPFVRQQQIIRQLSKRRKIYDHEKITSNLFIFTFYFL